eukprot:44962_1
MDSYTYRSKWSSQQIQKQCKNNRHNDFSSAWSKYSNSNASRSWTHFCNEYHKDQYTQYSHDDDIQIMDEYELNLHQSQYWRCTMCTYDNIERDRICSICTSPFQPPSYDDTNASRYTNTTLSDYMPSQLTDTVHHEDDFDESIQIAIILSCHNTSQTDSDDSDDYVYSNQTFADQTQPREQHTKPLLNGYKSVKGKRKKNFTLKDKDGSELSFRNRKQWQAYKRKQKQRNHDERKQIRRNHRKCIDKCPKLLNLMKQRTMQRIKQQISNSYNDKHFDMKCVLNYNVLLRFVDAGVQDKFDIVYHGTNDANNSSIIDKGLIVGGSKGVPVQHGSAYGRGVYCSPDTSTARCYESGSMFVCVVKNHRVNRYRSIWVVPKDSSILPLFLASFEDNRRAPIVQKTNNNVSKANDGLSQKIIKFIPQSTPLNKKKTKVRRKWNGYVSQSI